MECLKRKVVIVGTGFVGMSLAYSILNQGVIEELVLIDINKEKTVGEAMDLNDGLPYAQNKIEIKSGDYEECKNADIVVITAGINQKDSGENRLELTKENSKIVKSITEDVVKSGFQGIFLVASNPVDIMTYVVQKVSGFPKEKVIGSGTVLDTARLRYSLSQYLGVSTKNIHAYILGEHGDSSFVPWSHSYVGCKPLLKIMEEKQKPCEDLEKISKEVRGAAYEIIKRKKATYYGIGMSLTRIIKAIINNEEQILTISCLLEGEYEEENVYIGVPAIIGKNGVKDILELDLIDEEKEKLKHSATILKTVIQENIIELL